MNVQITDLRAVDEPKIQQVARLIVEGFKEHWPDAWPDLKSALQEVQESLEPIASVELLSATAIKFWDGLAGLNSMTVMFGNCTRW
jgi:aminoglycoside 6'-N-acetyltransferase I